MPHPDQSFTCVGCRAEILVCDPVSGVVALECPVSNCRRVVWALPQSEPGGAIIGTNQPPPPCAGRFCIDQFRLTIDGRELLAGPADLLAAWAEELNAANMPDHEIPRWLRLQIQRRGRGCAFVPGAELVRLGYRARDLGAL